MAEQMKTAGDPPQPPSDGRPPEGDPPQPPSDGRPPEGDPPQPPSDGRPPEGDRPQPARPPQPPPPPWREEPQRRRRQASHPGLDREQIVDAGLRLVDAEGAEALSIRRLAADLRVTPMALYWHVRDKAELLDLIGERVLESVVVPAPGDAGAEAAEPAGDWRRQLRDVHLAMLGPLLEHPNAVELMVGRARFGRAGISLFERILEILREGGLAPAAAFDAYQSLYLFQLGFTATARRSPEFRATQAEGAAYLRSLDPAAFPAIAEVAPVIGARPLAEQYAVGLDVVIEGIAAALPRGEVAAG